MKADSIITGTHADATSSLVGAAGAAAQGTMQAFGHLVAAVVSLRRQIVRHTLTDDECERAGLPYESTEQAVYLVCARGPWWHFAACRRLEDGEVCIALQGFGCTVEVWWYVPAGA